jgi:hypothetical protein
MLPVIYVLLAQQVKKQHVISHAGGVVPAGERPSVCCAECQAAEFCNLWRWCSSPAGCGKPGECTSYTTAARYNGLQPNQRFGPYNSISNACTKDGRWPYGMCSLMMVQSAANGNYTMKSNSSGFVSGMIAAKLRARAGCPVGVSSSACAMCLATKNPASCFTLVKRSYQFQPEVPVPATIAAVCANMSSQELVNTCMWCRTRDYDCLMNVLRRHADNPAAAEVAVKCMQSFRDGKTSSMAACSTCPEVKDPKLQAACFNCYNKTLRAGSFWPDGCSRCFGQLSKDPAGCSSCVVGASLKFANNSNPDIMVFADEVNTACFQCSQPAIVGSTAAVQQAAVASCYKCIGNAPSNKAYCTAASAKKLSTSSAALLPSYFKCLNGSIKQPNKFNGLACKACLQDCGGKREAAAGSCFSCAAEVPAGYGALCAACHCGVGKVKARDAAACEACAARPRLLAAATWLGTCACARCESSCH